MAEMTALQEKLREARSREKAAADEKRQLENQIVLAQQQQKMKELVAVLSEQEKELLRKALGG